MRLNTRSHFYYPKIQVKVTENSSLFQCRMQGEACSEGNLPGCSFSQTLLCPRATGERNARCAVKVLYSWECGMEHGLSITLFGLHLHTPIIFSIFWALFIMVHLSLSLLQQEFNNIKFNWLSHCFFTWKQQLLGLQMPILGHFEIQIYPPNSF
jgi:hypothetical protein